MAEGIRARHARHLVGATGDKEAHEVHAPSRQPRSSEQQEASNGTQTTLPPLLRSPLVGSSRKMTFFVFQREKQRRKC